MVDGLSIRINLNYNFFVFCTFVLFLVNKLKGKVRKVPQPLYFHGHSKIRFVGILMFANVYLRSYR